MLEAHGYRVLTASDGAEALATYSRERGEIKLVLMDLMMPVLGGPEAIRMLRQMDPGMKIIAVSGMPFEGKSGPVPETEVVAMLSKPFSSDVILRTIATALGKRLR